MLRTTVALACIGFGNMAFESQSVPHQDHCYYTSTGNYQRDSCVHAAQTVAQTVESKPKPNYQEYAAPTEDDAAHKRQQLQAEKDTAHWTMMLFWAAIGTAVVLVFQSVFLCLTVGLTRKSLVATLRPRLAIREVDLAQDVMDQPLIVSFRVVNIGGTSATVVESRILIDFLGDERFYRPHYANGVDVFEGKRFAAGESGTFAVSSEGMHLGSFDPPLLRLCLLGYIIYKDDLGSQRRIGFARECLDRDTPRFRSINDDAYEYED